MKDIIICINGEATKAINFIEAKRKSPVELRVYDSQDRVTGLIGGKVEGKIPCSVYDNGIITIFFPTDVYRHEAVGTDEGKYGLEITLSKDGETTTFIATDIPTFSQCSTLLYCRLGRPL